MARDPKDWPFLASSIYNMPIGDGAIFAPAGIHGVGSMPLPAEGLATMRLPWIESERITMDPAAPNCNIYVSSAGWSGSNRCAPTGGLLASLPIATSYTVPHNTGNSTGAHILADGVTARESIPFTRCTAGGDGTALEVREAFSIVGSGRELINGFGVGSHGGSRLHSLGGTLRVGELRPGDTIGPRHVLKCTIGLHEVGFDCTVSSQAHRWPATAHDGIWNDASEGYGHYFGNTNSQMVMGSLLAIPGTTDIETLGFETTPGLLLAWTFQNYGCYIVDNGKFHWNIAAEVGSAGSFITQFSDDWGFAWQQTYNQNSPWTRDAGRIYQALQVVTNNGPNSIGGGGNPRVDYAPLMDL